MQLNIRKTNRLVNKWTKVLNRQFFKENILMVKRHMKRCSSSVFRKIQIKTTVQCYLIPVRRTRALKNKNKKLTNVGKDVEKREPSHMLHIQWNISHKKE